MLGDSKNLPLVNSVQGQGVNSINALSGDVVLVSGSNITLSITGNTITINGSGGGGGGTWGSITGTLSDQTDLQSALDAKQNALAIGDITDAGTDGITITGGTGAIIGSGVALSQHVADASHNGYLSSANWITFNSKQAALGFTPEDVANKSTNTALGTSDTLYPSQKAVKTYIDTQLASLGETKEVKYATTGALTELSYTNNGGVGDILTLATGVVLIDGQSMTVGDRVLIKNQATASHNGIYTVTTVGIIGVSSVFTRATDFDQESDGIADALIFVLNGTANDDTRWSCVISGMITWGTTNINFSQFLGGTYSADETTLHLGGTTFSIKSGGVTEGLFGFTDITTADVSTSQHGLAPKLPNDATKYLDGTGAYSVPSGGGSGDIVSNFVNSPVTSTNADANAAYNKLNIMKATTGAHTITLPAPSANKVLAVEITNDSTYLITLSPNSTEKIDGASSRIMWAGETAILWTDGTNWFKMGGKSIRMTGKIYVNSTTQGTISSSTGTQIIFDTAILDNTGLMCDAANHYITVRRAGTYRVTGQTTVGGSADGGSVLTGACPFIIETIVKNSTSVFTNVIAESLNGGQANGYGVAIASDEVSLAAGDILRTYAFINISSGNVYYIGGSTYSTFLTLVETNPW